jgi:hypothetical protein
MDRAEGKRGKEERRMKEVKSLNLGERNGKF